MRNCFLFLLLLMVNLGFSQFENPKKSIRIGAVKDVKAPPKKVDLDTAQATIKYESSIGKNKDEKLLKGISIAPTVGLKEPSNVQLRNPSEIYTEKIQNQMKKEGITKEILNSDYFLGEFVVYTTELNMSCRDYSAVDGDVVRIWLNGEMVVQGVTLESGFRKFQFQLKEGLNIIQIEALNTGEFFPNTGQFVFLDGNKKQVTNQNWGLNSGYKAIVKIRKLKGMTEQEPEEKQ